MLQSIVGGDYLRDAAEGVADVGTAAEFLGFSPPDSTTAQSTLDDLEADPRFRNLSGVAAGLYVRLPSDFTRQVYFPSVLTVPLAARTLVQVLTPLR